MASHSSAAVNMDSLAPTTFRVPSAYPPCIRAANKLHPIVISQMIMDTHHRGKRTLVHVLTPPRRAVALIATAEDEEGTKVWLQLYHQPSEIIVPAEKTLRPGRCYLIKEPLAMFAPDGSYTLRVDHPSDIILLPDDHEYLPVKWRKSEASVGDSREVRMKGNGAIGKKGWAEAEELYTAAAGIAETAEELQLAYLNRSLANLRLGRPATALADAIKSYGGDSSAHTEKSLFREASALYELAKYGQCIGKLQAIKASNPNNASAMPMIDRVQARLREQEMGHYDFRHMYKQAEATPPLIDCATYTMPVEIRNSPGKGRGIFTTRKVLAGEMLICEKAFGYVYGGKDHPRSENMTEAGVNADLCTQIVQKLAHNVEDVRLFGNLYHGDYEAASVYQIDGKPVVDACLVGRTISLTNYRAPRTSLSLFAANVSGDIKGLEEKPNTTGVWSFISHINHSCISNSMRSFIGDMQIVRATRDLEAGTEVVAWYYTPKRFESYNEAQKRQCQWGFTCGCALCVDRKVTPERVRLNRIPLLKELMKFLDNGTQAGNILKAQKKLEQLSQTYSAAAREPGSVRLELWDPYFALGEMLSNLGKPSEAIEMILKGLEALGFLILANPPRGAAKSSRSEFQIKQWGLATAFCVDAFRLLHRAYKTVAPENSTRARAYMETAYGMFVGEKETILDVYPDLDE